MTTGTLNATANARSEPIEIAARARRRWDATDTPATTPTVSHTDPGGPIRLAAYPASAYTIAPLPTGSVVSRSLRIPAKKPIPVAEAGLE